MFKMKFATTFQTKIQCLYKKVNNYLNSVSCEQYFSIN